MKKLGAILFLLVFITSCNDVDSKHSAIQNETLNDSLYFRYDSIVNGEHRFIEFREDEMVWGNDSVTFAHPYDGSMDLDNMHPKGYETGYNLQFLENEIKVSETVKYLYFDFENDGIRHGEIRKELFFYHDSFVNGEARFIRFKENEIVWGNDSVIHTHTYGTDVLTDCLNPKSNDVLYYISFSDNYIVHQWQNFKTNLKQPELYQNGTTISIFNLENNNIHHLGHVNSIDLKYELFICQQYEFYGSFHYKYPFVISSFDESHSQFLEIEIDDNLPNPVTNFRWLQDTLITTYVNESNETIVDTTVIDYNSEVKSHLLDERED